MKYCEKPIFLSNFNIIFSFYITFANIFIFTMTHSTFNFLTQHCLLTMMYAFFFIIIVIYSSFDKDSK